MNDREQTKKLLESFVKYLDDYPDQRFWQALSNWSENTFIYTSEIQKVDNDLIDMYAFNCKRIRRK